MTDEMTLQLQAQLKLERARATDLKMLEEYQGREVVIDTPSTAYGGILSDIGSRFVKLTDCKQYDADLHYFEKHIEDLGGKSIRIPDKVFSISGIGQIVLLEDLEALQ